MIPNLFIPKSLLQRAEDTHVSSFCFVANSPQLEKGLKTLYGRDGLCLKVFQELGEGAPPDPEQFFWVRVPLSETTRVQNLYALYGLAPRVYDIVLINKRRLAQVTDYVLPRGEPDIAQFFKIADHFHIRTVTNWDIGERNWRGRQFVDFSGLYFGDKETYITEMKDRAQAMIYGSRKGETGKKAYQAVPELGILGDRVMSTRIAAMGWGSEEFRGCTVLDLGCNLGGMVRAAYQRSALRSVGVDHKYIAGAATEVCNWLGYWNVDVLGLDLPRDAYRIEEMTGIGQFDVVFALSIFNHMGGYASWIPDLCKKELYLEGHGGDLPGRYEKELRQDFGSVAFLGYVTDNLRRPIFRCRK